ncbi:MAG: alanine dehydrogenase [Anaerolineales bacterium]|nr:alanine dehydrogenase [Anaerolineae bacterium]PWB77812.1 MAG: alanine dehydrogenase [Anaerolineales bacterium]
MAETITIGMARMHAEFGERRDFLPGFAARLIRRGAKVILEHGYGSGMGFTEEDYRTAAPDVQFAAHEEIYKQDYVLVLRCPTEQELKQLKPGATLMSMLHYPTRPQRVQLLRSLGVEGISLDSLKDDNGRRLVENLKSVAWNGLEVGFQVLRRTYPAPGMEGRDRDPIRATIMGVGAVGGHAVQAASRYGDLQLWQFLATHDVPGVQVTAIDYDVVRDEKTMREILSRTDILVDATQRPDPSKYVIPNDWLGWIPEHAVLVDLSVDPYNFDIDPPEVKGIEGIPQGNLDQYVFAPTDPAYERIPASVSTKNRRHVVSCYSWPGIHPKECMELYGNQLRPIMRMLIEKGGVKNIRPKGFYFERAIARAMLSNWAGSEKSEFVVTSEKRIEKRNEE